MEFPGHFSVEINRRDNHLSQHRATGFWSKAASQHQNTAEVARRRDRHLKDSVASPA